MSQTNTSPLTTQHVPAISKIHLAAFPNRALTCLGNKAVMDYYKTLFKNPNFCLCIGVFEGQTLLGYLIGGEMKGAMRSFLRRHFLYLFLHVLTHPWLLAKPIVRGRVSQALKMLRVKKAKGKLSRRDRTEKVFTVLVIAVDPAIQHHGVGKMLMKYAEDTATEKGYTLMHLSVDVENTQAIRFYERLEWIKDRQANWRGSMVKALPQA